MAAVVLAAVFALSSCVWNFGNETVVYAAEREIPEGYTPIYDIADLYAVRNDLEGNYILMNDIDMTEVTSTGGDYDCGTGWDSIEGFSGTLNGNGNRIIGLHIFGEFTDGNHGLFEKIFPGAVIQNLGVVDCDFNVTLCDDGYKEVHIGAITGFSAGNMNNCYVSGRIIVKVKGKNISYIGGLTGGLWRGGVINDCYNVCEIEGLDTGNNYDTNIGGICGAVYSGVDAEILHSYNMGRMKGNELTKTGGICGYTEYPFDYKNCFYLKGTAANGIGDQMDDSDCVSLSENQMKNAKIFTGYDFSKVWEIDPYCSYPYPQIKNNRMIRVKSIDLKAAPEKLIYNQGEQLQLENTQLELIYEDGIKTSIPLSLDILNGYDMMRIGEQTVAVTYGGKNTAFQIIVKEVPVSGITIPETLSLYRSGEEILKPVITPVNATDKSVIWESNAPDIVSVDNDGIVKGKSNGTAIITATTSNGLAASCTVTVLVPAVSIQLHPKNITLIEGESRSITAQVLPYESTDKILWRSGNSEVAEVYDGHIAAKKAGTVSVIAYTESGVQEICTVIVQKKKIQQTTENNNPTGGKDLGNTNEPFQEEVLQKIKAVKTRIKSAQIVKFKNIKLKLSGRADCDGYQIQYGIKKNFKGAKTILSKSNTATIKKLKIKKAYYIRARVYKKIAGTLYYGKWSSRKTIKMKK